MTKMDLTGLAALAPRQAGFTALLGGAMLSFLLAGAAQADDHDAAAKGAQIAQTTCSSCHDVSPHAAAVPPSGNKAPAFTWIASRHPQYLDGVVIRPPHQMWGVVISPDQSAALRAYFKTLRSAGPQS